VPVTDRRITKIKPTRIDVLSLKGPNERIISVKARRKIRSTASVVIRSDTGRVASSFKSISAGFCNLSGRVICFSAYVSNLSTVLPRLPSVLFTSPSL